MTRSGRARRRARNRRRLRQTATQPLARMGPDVQGVVQSFLPLRDDASWKCVSAFWRKHVRVSRSKLTRERRERQRLRQLCVFQTFRSLLIHMLSQTGDGILTGQELRAAYRDAHIMVLSQHYYRSFWRLPASDSRRACNEAFKYVIKQSYVCPTSFLPNFVPKENAGNSRKLEANAEQQASPSQNAKPAPRPRSGQTPPDSVGP